jgi:hypothetical protein
MRYPIAVKKLNSTHEFYDEVKLLYAEAEQYLLKFSWCGAIRDSVLYTNLGSKLCIFLFEIDNASSSEDDFIWIVAGDIPFIYLDGYGVKSTREALRNYIYLARDWVKHVKAGLSVDECYPFDVAPTIELAEMLETRATFIKENVIKNIADIYF